MNGKKVIIAASVLLLVLLIGGAIAYFSDVDTKTNTISIGKIEIETNWTAISADKRLPRETISTSPTITNTGLNPAYVFAEVVVPYANVITEELNGDTIAARDTQLFTFTPNSGWVQVGEAVKDTTNNVFKYIYAYSNGTAMTALSNEAGSNVTPAIFTSVQFANVQEGQSLEGTTKTMTINGYGIQTSNITDSNATAPADVWAVLNASRPVNP